MRFMFIVTSSHAGPPTPELLEAMHKLADREIKAGRMLDNGGLMPLAMGAQVRVTDGQLSVVDGPFVETKEVIGGYAIFELPGKEEALASAKRVHAAAQGLHAGMGRDVRTARVRPGPLRPRAPRRGSAGMTAADAPSRDPGRLADRAAAADHQPGEDAARCAAGRGIDAGGAAGSARAVAHDGVPEKPGAWLMATAKRRALDHLRRGPMLERKHAIVARDMEAEQQAMPDLDCRPGRRHRR